MPTRAVRAKAAGLEPLAMSFVLPHERKAMRLPVVPATLTSLIETMADKTIPLGMSTSSSKKGFLCRDPCYPLWVEQTLALGANFLEATGSSASWVIPAAPNKIIQLPNWDAQKSYSTGNLSLDGVSQTAAGVLTDLVPVMNVEGTIGIYVPPGSTFNIRVAIGSNGGNPLEVEVGYIYGGEVATSTIVVNNSSNGWSFTQIAGADLTTGEGKVPSGLTWIRQMRTGASTVTASNTPVLQMGFSSGGTLDVPGASNVLMMLPLFPPPEFNNSTLPYSKTRLNASAALFSNVTAVLNKEGTVLAGRLKQTVVDPWNFTTAHINSVHPKLRYFGPLEKGLYTFTTPGGNVDSLDDQRIVLTSDGIVNKVERPTFNFKEIAVYNAFVLSDLDTTAGSTLAVSQYVHLEFETTSSLFNVGVSHQTLETLHAAEVALLSFGHFHENPIHWAALSAAASRVLQTVAPMVAPVVAHYGQKLLDRGVAYLKGNPGDRKMTQSLAPSKPKPAAKPRPKARRAKVAK